MIFEVRWQASARRDLKRLDPPVQKRLINAVDHFARTGEGDVVRLVNVMPPEYRLRVGDWRVRFAQDAERRLLDVLRVLWRDKAYR
ncbi:MAG TPA: type II toxin-antitoxin system RelE/ParE family toxin [Thermoanaerobaculia bacterium]